MCTDLPGEFPQSPQTARGGISPNKHLWQSGTFQSKAIYSRVWNYVPVFIETKPWEFGCGAEKVEWILLKRALTENILQHIKDVYGLTFQLCGKVLFAEKRDRILEVKKYCLLMVYRPGWIHFGHFLQFYKPTERKNKIKVTNHTKVPGTTISFLKLFTALEIFLVQLFQLTSVFYGLIWDHSYTQILRVLITVIALFFGAAPNVTCHSRFNSIMAPPPVCWRPTISNFSETP